MLRHNKEIERNASLAFLLISAQPFTVSFDRLSTVETFPFPLSVKAVTLITVINQVNLSE